MVKYNPNQTVITADSNKMIQIGFFSGSRFPKLMDTLIESLELLANKLDIDKHTVVYGGGDSGLMSIVPKTFSYKGGNVIGIDAKMFVDQYGIASFGHQYVEPTFDLRQKRIINTADCFVALPGGVGTMYEIIEVMTYNDLHLWKHDETVRKRIFIFNHCGFYDSLRTHIQNGFDSGLISISNNADIIWCDTVDDLIESIGRI